jgi:hypothetical protein
MAANNNWQSDVLAWWGAIQRILYELDDGEECVVVPLSGIAERWCGEFDSPNMYRATMAALDSAGLMMHESGTAFRVGDCGHTLSK